MRDGAEQETPVARTPLEIAVYEAMGFKQVEILLRGGRQFSYHDATLFFKKHRVEIVRLLAEVTQSNGLQTMGLELFGDQWDPSDPLADNMENQNLLAWFGFEKTAHNIFNDE